MNSEQDYTFEILVNNNSDKIELIEIIKELNNDYPIPLVKKINIEEYVEKIMFKGFVIVAKCKNEIIGFTTFYANNFEINEAAFSLLGVLKEHRKYGVARKLFKESFNVMKNEGMKTVFSYTHKDNEIGIIFHESLGFCVDENRESEQKYNIALIKTL